MDLQHRYVPLSVNTLWNADAIAKRLGIGRASVYRALGREPLPSSTRSLTRRPPKHICGATSVFCDSQDNGAASTSLLLNGEGLEVPNDATPLDFLSAMYRDRWQPMHQRLKAAIEAAPYLHPRLAVTAVVEGGDFAARLERQLSEAGRLSTAKPSKVRRRS